MSRAHTLATATPTPFLALESPRVKPPRVQRIERAARDRPDTPRRLCCVACGYPITTTSARVEIAGAHEHHFVNPHGHDFHIGCFARAPGLRPVGPATSHYSWFPGAPWRVGQCGACGHHLGWSYGVPVDFVGLILDRLTAPDENASSSDG